ncbi:MAG TPA: acylneuraminate cytidylyltransferase family protein [Candidatus Paceibacterota bacterium]|nr:acylneuraminate cytidylyltransferase family protein [Candidatus Paceibacterota bacterium]
MNILGVIGARSGSKSIPHKNIQPLLGKPLFAWIAEAGKKSKHLSRIIVSTDSPEYAQLAGELGIEVPFIRPDELSGDAVPDFDYLHHAATWLYKQEGWKADIIVRLPPTAPLCTPERIDACIELLLNDPVADSSRTVVPAAKHPYKLWKTEGDYLVPFLSEEFIGLKDAHNLPRQSFPEAHQHIDVIALRWKTLVEDRSMAGNKIRYLQVPKSEAIDIDTDVDFMVAEELLRRRQSES